MNYRKTRILFLFSIFLLFVATSVNINAKVKEHTKTIDNFKYTYVDYQKSSVWIVKIMPLFEHEVQTLIIPEYIDGKKSGKVGK